MIRFRIEKNYEIWNLITDNVQKGDDQKCESFFSCPKCGNATLRVSSAQIRGIDEGQSTIKSCTNCHFIEIEKS